MKAVLLAGGLGTRISEESHLRPKPMIEIGGKPILWHIMKYLSCFGFNEFLICLGYKGYMIKDFFANYDFHANDFTVNLASGEIEMLSVRAEQWKVTLIETGQDTMTGGRLKRIAHYLDGDDDFLFTYGDGVADVDLNELVKQHKSAEADITVTAVTPPARFGVIEIEAGGLVTGFREKPVEATSFVNGGYFVARPSVLDLIDGDSTVWEEEPLQTLAAERRLHAYKHSGFWKPMDTLRDKTQLEQMWVAGQAPWKIWD